MKSCSAKCNSLSLRERGEGWGEGPLLYGAQVPARHRSPAAQSQFVVHTTAVAGRQYPMRQLKPEAQVVAAVH